MGMSKAEGEGCILAYEMGLGKTLSAIALVYTMLSESSGLDVVQTDHENNRLSRRTPLGMFLDV
jgi:SNF2 family DNA or RNA helicase